MRVIKTIKGIEINIGDGMAKGLYTLSKGELLTDWFDEEMLDDLMDLSEEDFEQTFKELTKLE